MAARDALLPLVLLAGQGHAQAARTLLSELAPDVLRVVRRALGTSHPDVEDVTQECAMELVLSLPRFRGESSVKHFARRVALLTAMNARRRLRAAKRGAYSNEVFDPELLAVCLQTPESCLLARARLEQLSRICDALPVAQSTVLALHYGWGHTITEIAEICKVPPETVRSRLRLAKRNLYQRVNQTPQLRALLSAR